MLFLVRLLCLVVAVLCGGAVVVLPLLCCCWAVLSVLGLVGLCCVVLLLVGAAFAVLLLVLCRPLRLFDGSLGFSFFASAFTRGRIRCPTHQLCA